ncbi:MAG: hypothetical protein KC609_21405 [Myxococcales bacterium]|nr:hypothetical protein [Myxococcales bacterium]
MSGAYLLADIEQEQRAIEAAAELCRGILRLANALPPTLGATPETVLAVAQQLDDSLAQLLSAEPEVVLFHRDGALFVNFWALSSTLGPESEAQLIERLRERQIGRIHWRFTPPQEEWQRIIEALLAAPRGNFGRLAQELADRGVSAMRLEKLGGSAVFRRTSLTPERRVRYVYFEAIGAAQSLFAAARTGNVVPLKWIKRAAQRIVDIQCSNDRRSCSLLQALSRVKNWGGYEANHATNSAIYSTALAVRLSLPRAIVYEIGVACFLHSLSRCFIPTSVETKPGPLDTGDWLAVRNAAFLAFPVIARMQAIDDVVMEVSLAIWDLRHRKSLVEAVGGASAGPRLGFYAQVIALCSAYDALTTARPYRAQPLSHEHALKTVSEDFSGSVNPVLLTTFCAQQSEDLSGLPLLLEGDRVGVVLPPPALSASASPESTTLTVQLVATKSGSPLDEVLELSRDELAALSRGSLCLADYPALQVPVLDAILEL